jgi:beta-lactam-binding protein with PASTA domain
MFQFITKRPFWVNLLVVIGLGFLIIIIFLQSLNHFTHHGEYLKIPEVKGKSIADATTLLEKQGFSIVIQDSIYNDTIPKLVVVKQFPEPDATVKVNRTVYLVVSRSIAPIIEMPNLINMSYRNAELELKARGLKLGDTSYRPDIAKNAVLEQRFKEDEIKPGTKIAMGSTISLVLGAGVGQEDMPVPDLIGMNYLEAKTLLEAGGIGSLPIPDPDVRDTANAFVYRQSPERYDEDRKMNRIRQGQMIDIWLSVIKPDRKPDSVISKLPATAEKSDF